MKRFYELWDAIQSLVTDHNEMEYPDFCENLKTIQKEDLANTIRFLYPLVVGIDFCQRDSSPYTSAYWVVELLKSFYEKNSIICIDTDTFHQVFDKQVMLLKDSPIILDKLFFSNCKSMEKSALQEFVDECTSEVMNNFISQDSHNDAIRSQVYEEVIRFIRESDHRKYCRTTDYFLNQEFVGRGYHYLPKAYNAILTQRTSSVAVERSFSEQSLIHSPSRSCLTHARLSDLMIIKCNLQFMQRRGNDYELRDYLFKNNPLRNCYNDIVLYGVFSFKPFFITEGFIEEINTDSLGFSTESFPGKFWMF